MLKKVERSSVNVLCRYDMISLLSQVLDCICDSCCTGCYSKCCGTTFKCCDSLLEYLIPMWMLLLMYQSFQIQIKHRLKI